MTLIDQGQSECDIIPDALYLPDYNCTAPCQVIYPNLGTKILTSDFFFTLSVFRKLFLKFKIWCKKGKNFGVKDATILMKKKKIFGVKKFKRFGVKKYKFVVQKRKKFGVKDATILVEKKYFFCVKNQNMWCKKIQTFWCKNTKILSKKAKSLL